MSARAANWRNLDLNLLVVFHVLMQEQSATGAAAKLNLSQPAVSHALSRLRGIFNDELFVRTPSGFNPTPFARNLSQGVGRTLEELRSTLEGAPEFEPATSEREFTVVLHNHAALVLAAPLAAAVTKEAPGVVLNLLPRGTINIPDLLDRGAADCVIGQMAAPTERFADVKLFDETFSAVLRDDHPGIGPGDAVSLEAIAGFPHLLVTFAGENTGFIDVALRARGLSRRIAIRAPLLAAGSILAQSDMMAIVGRRAAAVAAHGGGLRVLDLPFASPSAQTVLLWHRRFDDWVAHRWLRGFICRVARSARAGRVRGGDVASLQHTAA